MSTAVVTASYDKDLDRCRLLCESMDRRLKGDWTHYITVDHRDVALFRQLAGPRREIVDERDLLPRWLQPVTVPLPGGKRRYWLSPYAAPLRGWHVQQLRRLGIARQLSENAMLSVDSDVVIVRDFDPRDLWQGDRLSFYRKEGGVSATMTDHLTWLTHAGELFGLPAPVVPANDYINTMIGWRSDTVRDLLDFIEKRAGRSWVRAIIADRQFSECTIYGRYVDEVIGGAGHAPSDKALCHVLWFKETYTQDADGLRRFMSELTADQVAVGVQSFVGHSPADIRRIVLGETQ